MTDEVQQSSTSTVLSTAEPQSTRSGSLFPESSATDVKKAVSDQVLAHAKEYTNQILKYLLGALAGAVIASVWNLNGQIYQAVGATGVSTKTLELEILRLKDELKKQEQQSNKRDCLENKKVADKAGCYRGN